MAEYGTVLFVLVTYSIPDQQCGIKAYSELMNMLSHCISAMIGEGLAWLSGAS